jgi:hypothetical protein
MYSEMGEGARAVTRRPRPGLLAVAALLAVLGSQARAQLMLPPPCWQGTAWFADNPYRDWVDYCYRSHRDHFVAGNLDCWVQPVDVCWQYFGATCSLGCAAQNSCPLGCTFVGEWREVWFNEEPIQFACPEGRKPPLCESSFVRRIVR